MPKKLSEVEKALARETRDGPGPDDLHYLPPSDFEGFAEEGVEQEEVQ